MRSLIYIFIILIVVFLGLPLFGREIIIRDKCDMTYTPKQELDRDCATRAFQAFGRLKDDKNILDIQLVIGEVDMTTEKDKRHLSCHAWLQYLVRCKDGYMVIAYDPGSDRTTPLKVLTWHELRLKDKNEKTKP